MTRCVLTITLTVEGPFLTRATAAGRLGVDAPALRANGDPDAPWSIPGTLVKGRLREAWTDLDGLWPPPLSKPKIFELLGPDPSTSGPRAISGTRSVGRLNFKDWTAPSGSPAVRVNDGGVRHRIKIDADRGAADEGALQVIERVGESGERLAFVGEVRYLAQDEQEAETIENQIRIGLSWLTDLGGLTRVGFGHLVGVEIKRRLIADPVTRAVPKRAGNVLELSLTFDRPICVARHRREENVFESEEFVSGATLKGALAATWMESLGRRAQGTIDPIVDEHHPTLARHFSSVAFLQGLPVEAKKETSRPLLIPLSVVRLDEKRRFVDVALLERPMVDGERLSFQIDWKKGPSSEDLGGLPLPAEVRRNLRVRTAIDSSKRRAAEGQLFAYETISHERLVWKSVVFLDRVPESERSAVADELASLVEQLGEIRSVGKTKAIAAMSHGWNDSPAARTLSEEASKRAERTADQPGVVIVTLQSAALLASPADLTSGFDQDALCRSYSAVFSELSHNALVLKRYFARQELAGGAYLYHRFQGGKGAYRPFFLTSPGSVFILEPGPSVTDAAVSEVLKAWLTKGLDVPNWAYERHGAGASADRFWERCPYVPENGYGEVAINQKIHWAIRARPDAGRTGPGPKSGRQEA